jgi:hypothetical protein
VRPLPQVDGVAATAMESHRVQAKQRLLASVADDLDE